MVQVADRYIKRLPCFGRCRRASYIVLVASIWGAMFSLSNVNAQSAIAEIYDQFEVVIAGSSKVIENRSKYLNNYNAFEAGPVQDLLNRSDPNKTLAVILGQEKMMGLSDIDKRRVGYAIQQSFRRYAYEWLLGGSEAYMSLVGLESDTDSDRAILKIRRNAKMAPDLVFNVYVHKTMTGWKAYDFGFFGIRYSGLKRAVYMQKLKSGGGDHLVEYLEGKNSQYFNSICIKTGNKRGRSRDGFYC